MNIKKTKEASLENKKLTFLLMGFVFVLSLCYVALEWTEKEVAVYEVIEEVAWNDEELDIQQTQQQEATPDMVEAQGNYVDALNSLTEMLQKVSAQSERLTRDSEEMENLNRTLTGICKVYEMQLKSASQQIGTIDQINDQSRHMAQQIEQLNSIYARMIEAMTVNMKGVSNA